MDNINQQVPPVANQPPVKTSNNLSFVKALAYGFVIVSIGISIAVGGYLLGSKKSQLPVQNKTSITTSYSSLTLAPIDETANWKTYTSPRAKYSLKYPEEWPLVKVWPKDNTPAPPPTSPIYGHIETTAFSPNYILATSNNTLAEIFVREDIPGNFKTIKELKNNLLSEDPESHTMDAIDVKDASVGGIEAISYKGPIGTYSKEIISYAIINNNLFYQIVFYDSVETNKNRGKNIAIFDQILSTFKFTDKTNNNLSPDDITAIQQAVAEKIKQPLTEILVNFDLYNGQGKGSFATGQVGNATGAGGGARWYAAKVNNIWICTNITQTGLTCDEADKYSMPKDLLPQCLDQTTDSIITR